MDRIPTLVFADDNELSRCVAARIAAVIRDRNAAGATAVLGLATGSTPVGVYRGVGFKSGEWLDVGLWQRDLARRDKVPQEPQASVGTSE